MKKMKIVFCFLYFLIAISLIYITLYPNNKIIEGKSNIFNKIKQVATKIGDTVANDATKFGDHVANDATKFGDGVANDATKFGDGVANDFHWLERRIFPPPPPPPPPPVNGQMDGNNVWYIPSSSAQYYADLSSKHLIITKKGVYLYRLPNTIGYKNILTTGPLPPS